MIRGVMKAVLWLKPMPTENQVFETMDEALDWVRTRLAAEGLAIPDLAGVA